ncbi:Fe-S oxidoreductase/FAD/FMN-containing dehydrogenase [Thermanaeromonas toyohensis ToBE]|uniref:Fe-S oxidoreductase/FAD/FMN-containing dehydrogenase n=1 Tax=Thermanaeromonas toyohensis ToBE TaxID=698762 RepID=A0A1W1W281_9FIRM|nr:FAD-binding and (Fe-S)-binding domain-containing protein [Thermanaeromonas toyohensis]SMB99732.1 Fe-S oxidoreductase/FAD/FMN-containing dehydrogenase [Thermanaeromonas toyohensis ToBE]
MHWQSLLANQFGQRITFTKSERLLYSHDVASLPEMVTRLFKTLPDAVVQPETVEEVQFIVRVAQENGLPIVPRGAGTSGYGGAVPTRGGLVLEFSRFNRILQVDPEKEEVTVQAGVVWQDLEKVLRRVGLALRLYPTSAPGSTVGGWVAEGGVGIGSYEYGVIGANVVAVEAILPSGEIAKFSGSDLKLICGLEGITGLITSITLKCRKADEDVPLLFSFPGRPELLAFLQTLINGRLPAWHVSFSSPEFITKKQQALKEEKFPHQQPLVLVVYPRKREREVRAKAQALARAYHGKLLSEDLAQHEWEERFYPMRLKRLGPSLIPSEAIVPLGNLEGFLQEVEKNIQGLALEGTLIADGTVTILGFLDADERTLAYTIGYSKSLFVADLARKYGGRVYSLGLFFGDQAGEILGETQRKRLEAYKKQIDPQNLFNPDKILGADKSALRLALKMARFTRSALGLAENLAPKKPKESRALPKHILYEAYACAQCGYCRNVCTLFGGRGWESASPRGKWYLLRKYAEGKLELTQDLVNTFLLCTTCKRCDPVCQVNIPIQELWDDLRGVLIKEKGYATFPAFEMMGASFRLQHNIWANFRQDRDAWVPGDVEVLDRAEIGYWAGCTASYVETDIAENAVRILRDGQVPFTYLGKDEACCGVPFLVAGKWEVFEQAVRHNISELQKRGVKTLIVSCPGCWVALHHYYAQWAPKLGLEWKVKIKHITEVTADLVREGRLQFKRPLNLKITWHDPCHIGRHGGIYDPPREVLRSLPGVEFQEMVSNRENGRCCGSVLTRIGEPPTSDIIAGQRLKEAQEIGAETIITTCPCCEFQLRVGARSNNIPVQIRDFSNLVAEALGYEVKDPTPIVHEMWAVFATAIQSMSLDGMVEMMTELMPGMFGHLPVTFKAGMNAMKKMPGPLQDVMLKAAGGMMPKMMPKMMPLMLPKMLPDVQKIMERKMPNMPPSMCKLLPEMLPIVMDNVLPAVLPALLMLMKDRMLKVMAEEIKQKKGA